MRKYKSWNTRRRAFLYLNKQRGWETSIGLTPELWEYEALPDEGSGIGQEPSDPASQANAHKAHQVLRPPHPRPHP